MCNEQSNRVAAGLIRDDIQQLRIPLDFPEGLPNLEPRDSIRITDRNAILRTAASGAGAELVVRRWSWPGAGGRPVYNFRSEGRRFPHGRCLIVADGFYEFTDPPPDAPKKTRKTKWRFTKAGEAWFAIAGLWRTDPQVGEAYTMLTGAPGPDIAPYHDRQVLVLERRDWAAWLAADTTAPEALLAPSPLGTFAVEPAA
jgi:putative SOS response-associated peptidase YedK